MTKILIPNGALTALVTPFNEAGLDLEAFDWLVRFQISQGISGIVPVGTTGESPTVTECEHETLIFRALQARHDLFVMPGCGSNCLAEAKHYISKAAEWGAEAALVVDPYGPSSLEIRREYYGPIAKAFPEIAIVPYIIPGRTGCALLPEDLAFLNSEFPNVCAVKEATGDLARMGLTRKLTEVKSPSFQIFSGDDDRTFDMMLIPSIKACGVISVIANIAPAAVQAMCLAILQDDIEAAEAVRAKLKPLFGLVTISAEREVLGRSVTDKFRNPLPIKTALNVLGMPSGPCRQPLGKMSKAGLQKVRLILTSVWESNPEVLKPIEEFFGVNIGARLANDGIWAKLSY